MTGPTSCASQPNTLMTKGRLSCNSPARLVVSLRHAEAHNCPHSLQDHSWPRSAQGCAHAHERLGALQAVLVQVGVVAYSAALKHCDDRGAAVQEVPYLLALQQCMRPLGDVVSCTASLPEL